MIRNLIGAVDGPIPFLYLPGLTSMLLTSRFQRLGDLAAGTMVVVEESRFGSSVTRVEDGVVGGVLPLLPLRVSAGSEMARALSDYVRRRMRFGRDRREEIARHLAGPLRERYSLARQRHVRRRPLRLLSPPVPGRVTMRVVDRLAEREKDWRELQLLLNRMEGKRLKRTMAPPMSARPGSGPDGALGVSGLSDLLKERNLKGISAGDVLRLGELYRSACADLMLAEAHDLPRDTVAYLHALVGRAHNAVYRAKGFHLNDWAGVIFDEVPRRLRSDPMLRVARP